MGFMRAFEPGIANTKPSMRNGTRAKLNTQAASGHAALELSFRRHAPRAPRLKLRQRLDFSTRFPSVCTHSTRTTTRTAHTHERTQSLNFRRTAWRQPRLLQCLLDPFLSCRLTRRPLRSLNLSAFLDEPCLQNAHLLSAFADKVCLRNRAASQCLGPSPFWP